MARMMRNKAMTLTDDGQMVVTCKRDDIYTDQRDGQYRNKRKI